MKNPLGLLSFLSLIVYFLATPLFADCLDLRGQAESLVRRQQDLKEERIRLDNETNRLARRSPAQVERKSLLQEMMAEADRLKKRLADTNEQIQYYCNKK